MSDRSFDVIVVGGGSAGCVVAGRLAHESALEVALLELGDEAERHPESLAADGYKHAFSNDALMLDRFSARQPECANQRLFLGSGRGMGGSGAINGMVYTRGAREDYDAWPAGWRWDDVAPSFAAVEARLRVRPRAETVFTEAFVEAACEAGFRREPNLNGGDLSGVIGYETMNYEGPNRRNSYVAFVKDPGPRENLSVLPRTRVLRVVFEGRRAVGVEVERDGAVEIFRARREVVLCAGALETPKLLLLSGVGPGAELAAHEIPVVHDLAGVGANLHDHPNVTMFYLGGAEVDSFYPQLYGFQRANPASDLPPGQSDTCYVMYPARSSLREAAMRMLPTKLPAALYGGMGKALVRGAVRAATALPPVRSFIARTWGAVVILGKPKSRGRLALSRPDPRVQAAIDPGYFSDPEDMVTMLAGVKLARRIAAAGPLARFGNRARLPGGEPNDASLERFIRENVMTTFHYAGTCRMGEDAASVVDTSLRVRGLEGLRVADASVTPWTPVSAMNAPSMMVGQRAADFVLAELAKGPLHVRSDRGESGAWPAP